MREPDSSEVWFSEDDDAIAVVGDLNESNASAFAAQARELPAEAGKPLTLNLRGLEIADAISVAICVNVLRELRARVGSLVLQGAPQMLGHNLYRVGMLEGPRAIELLDMRLDEPGAF
jgi:ABC-type transporter Mla MlaB component